MNSRPVRRRVWGGGVFAAWVTGTLVAVAIGAFAGCNLHQEGVPPPDNRIFFPGGASIESLGPAAGRWLYVVNSNSDLRYNAGTVVAVDLDIVQKDRDDGEQIPNRWKSCTSDTRYVPPANVAEDDRCCWDYLDQTVLNCDEQKYIRRESTVRIGNFGGRPVTQQLPVRPDLTRVFIPVRGDVAIDMLEVLATDETVNFRCTGARADHDATQATFAICDPNWRITREDDPLNNPGLQSRPDDEVYHLPDEPYALAVDQIPGLLYAGHLRGGGISMIDLGCGDAEDKPDLVQVFPNLLPGDANGSQGVTSLTIKNKTGLFGNIYAASRFVPLVGSFVVYGLDSAPCDRSSLPGNRAIAVVGTGQFLSTGLSGAETRGIEFISSGDKDAAGNPVAPDRAFILQRTPPAVVAVDTGTSAPFATIEVCQSPTNLVQQTDAAGRTVALFVTCFDGGEVYVIDPWTPRLRTIIPVGRGPVATILPPSTADPSRPQRAYVVGFGANNIAVIDLDPGRATQYRVIQRMGFPSATPREVAK